MKQSNIDIDTPDSSAADAFVSATLNISAEREGEHTSKKKKFFMVLVLFAVITTLLVELVSALGKLSWKDHSANNTSTL